MSEAVKPERWVAFNGTNISANNEKVVLLVDSVSDDGNYLAFCEICPRFETFDNADHARNNGWEIANGQQFCPEHRG
jgi:hypothetical protein